MVNGHLALGEVDVAGLLPHFDGLKAAPYVFNVNFGLPQLPTEPGILMIRGARQYGKSTWLEQEIYKTIQQFGAGTAFYLNGEYLLDVDKLEHEIELLVPMFVEGAAVRRIFIDEITAIPKWEIALKRLADKGSLAQVLLITTGSKATDLRRGAERLPGRKGRLDRTTYLFTPISYREFHRVCGEKLGDKCLIAYLLSGGSPIACSELAAHGVIPEYVVELVRDWIEGEVAATGRSRISLYNIFGTIFRLGGTPVGQAKVAREAGLANNTVAAGYIEVLQDLGCIVPSYPWDQHKKLLILRKPCKYHVTNLLAAVVYHAAAVRRPDDFLSLPEMTQGIWLEWLVAQELVRRAAIAGEDILSPLAFWQNDKHELDFVVHNREFIEVKRGRCNPLEFSWFVQQFPGNNLTVVNVAKFSTATVKGVLLEDFLLAAD